jgi:hypothetical protein
MVIGVFPPADENNAPFSTGVFMRGELMVTGLAIVPLIVPPLMVGLLITGPWAYETLIMSRQRSSATMAFNIVFFMM